MEQIKKRNIDENCTKNVQSIVESERLKVIHRALQ